MNLFKTKKLLMIIHPIGGRRTMDYVFKTPIGICFFDDGWSETSNNPIHFVDGEIRGKGPWTVGDSRIEVVTDQAVLENHAKWVAYKKANGITDAQAEELFKGLLEAQEKWPTEGEAEATTKYPQIQKTLGGIYLVDQEESEGKVISMAEAEALEATGNYNVVVIGCVVDDKEV